MFSLLSPPKEKMSALATNNRFDGWSPNDFVRSDQRPAHGVAKTPVSASTALVEPSARQPKLRVSCDACAAAKVRCSKERPSCERCSASDYECVYGPSLKHGKSQGKRSRRYSQASAMRERQMSRSSQERQETTEAPRSNSSSYVDLQQSFDNLIRRIGSNKVLNAEPQPKKVSREQQCHPVTVYSPFTSFGIPDEIFSFSKASMDHRNFAPDTTNPSGAVTNQAPSSLLNSQSPSDLSFPNLDIPTSIDLADLDAPSDHAPSPTQSELANTAREFTTTAHSTDGNLSTHECYITTCKILSNLQSSLPAPLVNNSNSNDAFAHTLASADPMSWSPAAPKARSLDGILRMNQEAIASTCALLDCPCALEPHMGMLYGSILVKVFAWHRVAAGNPECPTPPSLGDISLPLLNHDPMQTSSYPTNKSSTPSLAGNWNHRASRSSTAVASVVSHEPVRIGEYVPCDEDQGPIRRLLLLSNLKKAGPLIEKFNRIAASSHDPAVSSLYSMLASWLTSELGRTVRDISGKTESGHATPMDIGS